MLAHQVVDPQVSRLVGGLMGNDHTIALRRELVWVPGKRIQTVRQAKLFPVVGCTIDEIRINHTVFV